MPTFNLRPQALVARLPTAAPRMQVLATTTRWRALSATTRWQVLGAIACGLVLLSMYVMTLQTAVERGETLREQRRQQGIEKFGAGAPAAKPQSESPSSTGS